MSSFLTYHGAFTIVLRILKNMILCDFIIGFRLDYN